MRTERRNGEGACTIKAVKSTHAFFGRPSLPTGPIRFRSGLFCVGDCLFLMVVGSVATWTMHMTHELGWSFFVCMVLGMALAMVVQTVLAWCVAPILGSIETMVPSMVLAMVSPMSVCSAHLLGYEPDAWCCIQIGVGFGLLMFVFIEIYGVSCRRLLDGAFGGKRERDGKALGLPS